MESILQARAAAWHAARFPTCTQEDIGLKSMAELGEVADAILAEGRDAAHPERAGKVLTEAADVLVTLLALCGRFGHGDLLSAVGEKLRILETPGGRHPGCLPDAASAKAAAARPVVVCLCGSTRFMDVFDAVGWERTVAGEIVLSVGVAKHVQTPDGGHVGEALGQDVAERLDELHKRKIDMADYVLVLNVGGYMGDSTRSEIAYAVSHGKEVRFLEQPDDEPWQLATDGRYYPLAYLQGGPGQ